MNNDHVYGKLRKMKIGNQLEGTPIKTLILRPKPQAKTNNRRRPEGANKSADEKTADGTSSGIEEEL